MKFPFFSSFRSRLHAGGASESRRLGLAGVLALMLALAAPTAWAQPGSGGPGPGTQPPDPTDVPLDGGASLLLASGVGYAVRRLRQKRRPRS